MVFCLPFLSSVLYLYCSSPTLFLKKSRLLDSYLHLSQGTWQVLQAVPCVPILGLSDDNLVKHTRVQTDVSETEGDAKVLEPSILAAIEEKGKGSGQL
jgi:hypothetical protein